MSGEAVRDSDLVDKIIRFNLEGCYLSHERPDGERAGSQLCVGPQDATSEAMGGLCHWARDLVRIPLPPGGRGLFSRLAHPWEGTGSQVLQTLPSPTLSGLAGFLSSQNEGTV